MKVIIGKVEILQLFLEYCLLIIQIPEITFFNTYKIPDDKQHNQVCDCRQKTGNLFVKEACEKRVNSHLVKSNKYQ
ncbi:hypothetical protein SAMN05421640_1018 [Ekhidna lutea]|uniref:Uncharacterized protein n=1 Tax=Ekhidna lutea TaxID=447679 RepID=A0A239GVW4_EKHLU|nr:hypothetical protein [Ekhidna lutea]SNS72938.1 hypothetical protein SAMN05421640_1018 [Ekhidna lutea]